jgi:5-methylcytosine-specific restriction enzyme subunit McrC
VILLPPGLQDCTLHPQAQNHTKQLATANGQQVFRLKPDLLFRQGDSYPLLVDTKYKRLSNDNQRLGISQSDFYQMYAYAHRYHCPRVVLIYPQTAGPLQADFKLIGHDATISAVTLNLHRDLSQPSNRQALAAELKGHLAPETNYETISQLA